MGLDPRTFFRSTGGQLLLALAVVLTAGALFQIWQSQRWDLETLETHEAERLRGIAAATAAHVDGASHEAAAQANPAKDAFETWEAAPEGARTLHAQLAAVAGHAALESPVYTLRLRDDARAAVMAAPDEVHKDAMEFIATSAAAPYWRHTYQYKPEMRAALLDGVPATTPVYADDHGEWLSAYAPVTDAEGRVVAILEVDAPFTMLQAAHDARFAKQILLVAGVGAGGFVLLAAVARRFSRGFGVIEAAARRMGEGDLKTPADPGPYSEVAHLAGALEQARAALAARAETLAEAARRLGQQRDLALRGIDDAAIGRRKAFAAAAAAIDVATRVGEGRPQRVRLADLNYSEATILASAALDLAPGTPLRVRIACKETGQHVTLPTKVMDRTPQGDKAVEYRLRLLVDGAVVPFPRRVARIMNGRAAMRVRPTGERPVRAILYIGDKKVPTQVVDVSATGLGLRVPRPAATVGHWGTRIHLELFIPGVDKAIPFTTRLARLGDTEGDRPLLGLQLLEGEEGGFARRQQLVAEYVDARNREAVQAAAAG
jgi:hypothetical protein